MKYSELVGLYEDLSKTTKKLEKARIIADFLPKLKDKEEYIYLLRGRVFPDYDVREFGISTQLLIRSIAKASGSDSSNINDAFKKIGDLGDIAFTSLGKNKQKSLFSSSLTVEHVFSTLKSLSDITGDKSIEKKVSLIAELLISASPVEARYLVRTLLSDLRVGVADAILLDAITLSFFPNEKDIVPKIKNAYDLLTDFALVLKNAFKGKEEFEHIHLVPGRALNVMLAVKALDFEEAFRICGKPAALEYKYDGFRVIISSDGKKIKLFTRRLEEVTNQFPDIVENVKKNVKAEKFILDAEAVGYDIKTGNYLPFEAVSQRIKRKYDIDKLIEKLPVEVNVFDLLYLDGKNVVEMPFIKRRELLQKLINNQPLKVSLAKQIITDNEKIANEFYEDSLNKGYEGIMVKNLNAIYKPGRAVGYLVKMKPEVADLDLVIVGAEYGTGKRAGNLTSYILACKNGDEFLEVGKVSSGLKEKESEGGTTYAELDKILRPLIIKEEKDFVSIKPKVIVSVSYQNIQKSTNYSSGFALRFPRVTHYRPERGIHDIASLDDIKKEVEKFFSKNKNSL